MSSPAARARVHECRAHGLTFASAAEKEAHRREHHLLGRFKCNEHALRFKTKEEKDAHDAAHHPPEPTRSAYGTRIHRCRIPVNGEECGETRGSKKALAKHQRLAHRERFHGRA